MPIFASRNQNEKYMMTTTLAKELIRERLEGMKETTYGWVGDEYTCRYKVKPLLPNDCGSHLQDVYNGGIVVNAVRHYHYKENDCLHFAEGRIARRVLLVVEPEDEENAAEKGKIYVTICPIWHEGNGEISCDDREKEYSLEELEQSNPEFLKNLVFNLK